MKFIYELMEKVEYIKESIDGKSELFFRGQTKYEYKLLSTLSRRYHDGYEKAQNEVEKTKIVLEQLDEEIKIYEKFNESFFEDIKTMKETYKLKDKLKLIKPFEFDQEKNIISVIQHYKSEMPHEMPTRCLDFTYSLLVALFFSLPKELKQNNDSALWIVNKHKLLERYINKDTSRYQYIDKNIRDKGIKLDTSKDYENTISSVKDLYEKRLNKLIKKPDYYEENCLEIQNEKINKLLGEIRMDIEDKDILNRERYSTLEENLYCGGLNERICRQNGLFIIQRFRPTDMVEEFKDDRDTSGVEPFIKIRIPSREFENIKKSLDNIGINERSIYNIST